MEKEKQEDLKLFIEASILRVALESACRRGSPKGTVFSPANMARKEAEKIIQYIKENNHE